MKDIAFKNKLQSVRLPLFEKKFKAEALENGFLSIKDASIIKTQKNIELKINERRNPNILLRNLNNLSKSKLKEGFTGLKLNSHRISCLKGKYENMHRIIEKIIKVKDHQTFDLIRAKAQYSKIYLKETEHIIKVEQRAVKRLKAKAFYHLT